MLARDHLNLSLVRLNDGDRWVPHEDCLNFIFPSSGHGLLRVETSETSSCRAASGNGNGNGDGHGEHPLPCVTEPPYDGLDLEARDVLVLNGASPASLCNHSRRQGFVFSTFSLCLEHLFPLFAGRDIVLLDAVKDAFKAPKLHAASTPLAAQCHTLLWDVPPQFDLDHRSQLLRVAAAVICVEFKAARAQRSGFVRVEERITQVLESLSVTEILHASVPDLAKKFACTTRHLNRLFHRHFGCSVASFKMEMRLLKAASLLCDPTAKVVQVASQCGFNFLGQFNACFRRRFNMSPSEWRQAHPAAALPPAPVLDCDAACRMQKLGLCPWRRAEHRLSVQT